MAVGQFEHKNEIFVLQLHNRSKENLMSKAKQFESKVCTYKLNSFVFNLIEFHSISSVLQSNQICYHEIFYGKLNV